MTTLTFDYSRLTGSGEAGVPFSSHVGVVIERSGPDGASARLDPSPQILNHVGSLHGGAVFTVAAGAAGAAVAGALVAVMDDYLCVARRAEIDFLRIAHAPLTAQARLAEDPTEVLATAARAGAAGFTTESAVFDGSEREVARLTLRWELRRPRV